MSDTRVLAFGTGVFLRAFVCDFASGAGVPITMVSSTAEGDRRVAHLNARGGRFTLAYRGVESDGSVVDTWREVRSIQRALSAAADWPAVLETARDPAIRVVVSNVTESALKLADNPDDDRPDLSPPASFPAKLTQWLHARFRHFGGEGGVDILPCELIEGNGVLLRGLVEDLAHRWELSDGFFSWLHSACIFADTLVDRIVPGLPPDDERATLWRERLSGDDDPLLTIAEPFAIWAIKGDAALAQRLDWLVRAGNGQVVVTPDITPYVFRKVRILNGLHTAMASIAPGYGVATVREAIEHPELGPFLRALVDEEIVPPICPPLDPDDARAYADQTWARMSNPFLVHKLSDIAKGAPAKWENRLLPTMRAYEERFGVPPPRITACRKAFVEPASRG